MNNYGRQLVDRLKHYFLKIFLPSTDHSMLNESSEKFISIGYRQLNWILGALLLFGLMNFVAGYFWGQRKAVEYFVKRIEEDSFADRISYAVYTMNDRDSGEFEDADTDSSEASDADADSDTETNDSEDENETENELLETNKDQEIPADKPSEKPVPLVPTTKTIHFARLAGFGSQKAAQTFLNKITTIDPKSAIAERTSRTAKGRKIIWYQVVTGEFDDKKDLDRIVGLIKNKEHINEVQIVTQTRDCNPNPVTPRKG